jgi:hypothetical protein
VRPACQHRLCHPNDETNDADPPSVKPAETDSNAHARTDSPTSETPVTTRRPNRPTMRRDSHANRSTRSDTPHKLLPEPQGCLRHHGTCRPLNGQLILAQRTGSPSNITASPNGCGGGSPIADRRTSPSASHGSFSANPPTNSRGSVNPDRYATPHIPTHVSREPSSGRGARCFSRGPQTRDGLASEKRLSQWGRVRVRSG